MKIFFGNPPWKKGNRLGVRAGSRWPFTMEVPEGTRIPPYVPFPFFLAYAAAVLERERFPILLVDAIAEGLTQDQYIARAKAFNPDLILHETSTASFNVDLAIAKKFKETTAARIALSGPHVSVLTDDVMKENGWIDFVLIGEYELTLRELCEKLEHSGPLQDVMGLSFRRPDGAIVHNPRRPSVRDLDSLPWPARHFLPMHNYRDSFCDMPHPMLQLWSSRGCPFRCIFCLWPDVMYGDHLYRSRNAKDIVDEIETCHRMYTLRSFYFDDDTFNIGKERVIGICEEIKKRGIGLPWAAMCRADTMDEETLRAMKESGLIAVKYGIESSCQKIVDASGKNLDLEKADSAIELTKKLGVKFHLTFTFGLPGETRETIKNTIDYALSRNPDCLQFSLATPFPGTRYHDALKKKEDIIARSWDEYDGSGKSVIRPEHLSREELEHWLGEAHRLWDEHRKKASRSRESSPGFRSSLEGKDGVGGHKVTLYIPCHNAAKTIRECIESVLAQSYPVDEILLIDDGCTDETAAIASNYPVRIVRHGRNMGLAASRNTAFREARNEFVAAIDADVALDKDWLKTLMQAFTAHKIAGACGKLTERYQTRLADRWRTVHCRQHHGDERVIDPDFLFGSNTVMKKSALQCIGMYQEKYKTNFEDVYISDRLKEKGFTLVYEPVARAQHMKRDTLRSVLEMDWRWWIYYYQDKDKYLGLGNILRDNFRRSLSYLKEDVSAGRFALALVDCAQCIFLNYHDLLYLPAIKEMMKK